MLRKSDWIGVLGFAMLAFGGATFLGDGNGYLPLWVAWLISPLFWYGGFIVTTVWIVSRMVRIEKESATASARKRVVVELEPKRVVSNFLEHDYDAVGESSSNTSALYCAR